PFGDSTVDSSGTVNLTPLFCWEAKNYDYQVLDTRIRMTCTATGVGFAVPVYTWKVNGKAANESGPVTVSATVTKPDPTQPTHPVTSTQDISIYCEPGGIEEGSPAQTLVIMSGDNLGVEELTIEVRVEERHVSSHHASTYGTCFLETQ